MRYGHTALNGALSLTVRNLNKLEFLNQATIEKFPEMAIDPEYSTYVNELKNSLVTQEQRILKKKKAINKYNLVNTGPVRQLKKN